MTMSSPRLLPNDKVGPNTISNGRSRSTPPGEKLGTKPPYSQSFRSPNSTNNELTVNDSLKCMSLDRRYLRSVKNKGNSEHSAAVSLHATPKRTPLGGSSSNNNTPTTPSLWKRIFSFRKSSNLSSQKNEEKDNNKPNKSKKSTNDENGTVTPDTTTTRTITSNRRFKKISNRLINELRQSGSDSESISSTSSPSRLKNKSGVSNSTTYTQDINKNSRTNTFHASYSSNEPISDVNSKHSNGGLNRNCDNNNDQETDRPIKIVHYRGHHHGNHGSRQGALVGNGSYHCSRNCTPPLVMFSSDEDISSTQTTPVHKAKGMVKQYRSDNCMLLFTSLTLRSFISLLTYRHVSMPILILYRSPYS